MHDTAGFPVTTTATRWRPLPQTWARFPPFPSFLSVFPPLSFLGRPTLAWSLGSSLCFSHCCGTGRKSGGSPAAFPPTTPHLLLILLDAGRVRRSEICQIQPRRPCKNRSRRLSQYCIPGVKELMSRMRRMEKRAEQRFTMGGGRGERSLSL